MQVKTLQDNRMTDRKLMIERRLIPVAAALFFTTGSLTAGTIRVPADSPSIQEGIEAATDGDTVLVAPGLYRENIDFLGKAVTVTSEGGPFVTTIHGGRQGSVVSFQTGEGPASVLEGFTLTGGSGTGTDPYCYGGGVYCYFASPTIAGNVIRNNSVSYHGGGIYCLSSGEHLIRGNVIEDNRAENGAAIYCSASSHPMISGNLVRGNSAENGGGIYCNWESNPLISNNTFTGNHAGYGGGAIHCFGSSPVVQNSILWDNEAPLGPEIYLGDWLYPSTLSISYSSVEGGEATCKVLPECVLEWGTGMLETDPLWVYPEYGDSRLLLESPCIDAGHPDSLDPDGTRRDLGAACFDQADTMTVYLTPRADRTWSGDIFTVHLTIINPWQEELSFWLFTDVVLPGGASFPPGDPLYLLMPAARTLRTAVDHQIPPAVPSGIYEYRTRTGVPPATLFDSDSFRFDVGERHPFHPEMSPD